MEKVEAVRELLEIPKGLRIAQHFYNQLEAHEYGDFFYMPDDVFISIMKDKPDFSKIYQIKRCK